MTGVKWDEDSRAEFVSGLLTSTIDLRPMPDLGCDAPRLPAATVRAADEDATTIRRPARNPRKIVRFEPAVQRHLEHLRIRNLRNWTIYNRERALARLSAWNDSGPILKLTEDDLRRWQMERSAQLQPEPRRTELSHARQFYQWAHGERLIKADPSVRIPLPKVARGLPRPIRDSDLLTAIEAADPLTKAILGLGAFAGLRAHEIAGLNWAEVGLGDRSPHIRVLDGKGGHGRLVPLSATLTGILEALPYRRGPVIRRLDGRPGPNRAHRVSQRANDYLHELGITDSLHQCRHRFASTAYQSCRDIRAVQELLGHASPTTTSRYAAVASGVAIDAVEAAGTIWRGDNR